MLELLNSSVAEMPEDCHYMEVGTFKGLTLIGALLNNDKKAIAVDNFSEFEEANAQKHLVCFLKRFEMHDRVDFFEMDFRHYFTTHRVPKLGVYFYDGAHDEHSTYDGIAYAIPFLADNALIIIDDYCYPQVQVGVKKAVDKFGLRIAKEIFTPNYPEFDPEWWNGIGVLLK